MQAIRGDVPGALGTLHELATGPAGSELFDIQAVVPAAMLIYRRGCDAPVAPEELAVAEGIDARYQRFGPGIAALTIAQAGDPDRARRMLDEPFAPLEDYMWLVLHTVRGDAAATTGHLDAAKDAYAVLEPHEGLIAGGETLSLAYRPVAITLARLAGALGDHEGRASPLGACTRDRGAGRSPRLGGNGPHRARALIRTLRRAPSSRARAGARSGDG